MFTRINGFNYVQNILGKAVIVKEFTENYLD
jgi:hypothetical protein